MRALYFYKICGTPNAILECRPKPLNETCSFASNALGMQRVKSSERGSLEEVNNRGFRIVSTIFTNKFMRSKF